MNLDKRLKQIENKLIRKSITSEPFYKTDIPKETWIGAYKVLIEAGVIKVKGYQGTPDQLASEICQGTITEADCLTNQNGDYDLSPLTDEQLNHLEILHKDAGLK
jgi:hypothetical protein